MKVFLKLFAEFNLGDDLFLKIILNRYPNVNFVLNAKKEYNNIIGDFNNLQIVEDKYNKKSGKFLYKVFKFLERKIFPALYKKSIQNNLMKQYGFQFSSADVHVSIGGSIFMQPKKLPSYLDIEYYTLVNKSFDNIFYIGCNFGPYSDPIYKKSYDEIFHKASDVCFREKASWEIFSSLNNTRYRPDVVFGLDFPRKTKKENTVGFSVVNARNGIDENSYLIKYAELIKFYQNNNYEIFLFSFCEKQGDKSTIKSIVKMLENEKNINQVFYDGDIESFLEVYSSVQKVYCGRFHAMILSMIFNQQIYPIAYSKKMTNVLEDINYEGDVINIENFHLIDPNDLDQNISLNKYNVEESITKSREQFEKLDLILNK